MSDKNEDLSDDEQKIKDEYYRRLFLIINGPESFYSPVNPKPSNTIDITADMIYRFRCYTENN